MANISPLDRFKSLSENEQQIVQAIKGVEVQYQTAQYEFQLELFELKKKYSVVFDRLYDRRKALLAGGSDFNSAELDAGEQTLKRVLGAGFTPLPRTLRSNGLANFWLAVFVSHPGLSMVISPDDARALQHLADIRCTYFGGKPTGAHAMVSARNSPAAINLNNSEPLGFKLFFYFTRNEYFSNEVLEKTYYYKPDTVNDTAQLKYEKAVGCSISWKEGKNLTAPGPNDQGGWKSFFAFFSPKILPSKAELLKLSNEEFLELLQEIEGDMQCGEDIRDEVIPFALSYLLESS